MITVINDFNTRVREIDEYYILLDNIVNQNSQLYYPNKVRGKYKSFDEDLIKVMKANCFLLLYNLIESSIKSAICEVYDSITNSNKRYDQVIDEIRKIWLKENYRNFNNLGSESIFNYINNISNDIINIRFNPDKVISGNLDGGKIREFSKLIGFSNRTHHRANNGSKLVQVKTQRNKLAHGDVSFSECGRQYTYEDLEETKKQVVIYLRGILNNVKRYIDNNEFSI